MLEWIINLIRPFQFKGKARLFSPLVAKSGTRNAVVNGFKMNLDLGEHIQRMIFLGAYERWETRVISRYLRPGMTVVDVGANVGYYSLLASRIVGSKGRVIAIEPSPLAGGRLGTTIANNRIENLHLERCGLGRCAGEAILYESSPTNHTPTMLGDPGKPGVAVPIKTLDELVGSLGIERIDLLKIDVEGYEPEVFAGAKRLFEEGRIRAILCEFNEHWLNKGGTTGEAVYMQLIGKGFVDQAQERFIPGNALDNRFLVYMPSGHSAA